MTEGDAEPDGPGTPPGTADGLRLPPPPAQRRGHIVRRSYALAFAHWWPAITAAAVLLLPMAFVTAFAEREWMDARLLFDSLAEGGPGPQANAVLQFVEAVVLAPWALAAALLVLIGRGPVERAVGGALRRLHHAVGAMVLAALTAALPLLPAVALFLANMGEAAAAMGPGGTVTPEDFPAGMALAMLLFLLGVVPAAFVGLSLGLAVPLAVADGLGPVAACKASWRRMRGQRLRLLGAMLGVVLPAGFLLSMLLVPVVLLSVALGPEGGWVPLALGNGLLSIVVTVLIAGVYAVLLADTAPAESLPPDDAGVRWDPDAS